MGTVIKGMRGGLVLESYEGRDGEGQTKGRRTRRDSQKRIIVKKRPRRSVLQKKQRREVRDSAQKRKREGTQVNGKDSAEGETWEFGVPFVDKRIRTASYIEKN